MLRIWDRVKETTTTTGTGALALAGAMTGFIAFSAVPSMTIGDTCYCCVQAVNGSGIPTGDWEVALYTYSAASQLTHTTFLSSSTGSAVSWAAGTKQVWIDIAANEFATAKSKNCLINGAMCIDQRNAGAAQTFTAGAALAYSVDRWYGYCTGANVTGQRVAGSLQSKYRYQFTGAASVTGIGFGQRIESINSYHLNGTTATLSVDLANSLLTTVTWTAYYANTDDTFGTLATPTRTQIATGSFTVNSAVTRFAAQILIPSAATTGVEIVFSVGAQTSGTWTIGNVQLEKGLSETDFERTSCAIELTKCQRYLPYWSVPGGSNNFAIGQAYAATNVAAVMNYFVIPRVIPTGIITSGSFVATTAAYGVTPVGTLSIYANGTSLQLLGLIFATASGLVAGDASSILSSGAAASIQVTGCEL